MFGHSLFSGSDSLEGEPPAGRGDYLLWKDGWLVIRSGDCMYNEAAWILTYWPIHEATRGQAQDMYEIGAEMRYHGEGVYTYAKPDIRRLRFILAEGGRTKPIRTVRVPIPKPKERIVKSRKSRKNIPWNRAPFERIDHHWDGRTCSWQPSSEFLQEAEASALGFEW